MRTHVRLSAQLEPAHLSWQHLLVEAAGTVLQVTHIRVFPSAPETSCKQAEALWPSSFLLPGQQVAQPGPIWQTGPQGQASRPTLLML